MFKDYLKYSEDAVTTASLGNTSNYVGTMTRSGKHKKRWPKGGSTGVFGNRKKSRLQPLNSPLSTMPPA